MQTEESDHKLVSEGSFGLSEQNKDNNDQYSFICIIQNKEKSLKKALKSVSKGFQNGLETLFAVICILETLLGEVWNDFGLPKPPQKRSLRRPRGIKKRLLFSLASQEASRMDFGSHLDPLGLDFQQFLKVILA